MWTTSGLGLDCLVSPMVTAFLPASVRGWFHVAAIDGVAVEVDIFVSSVGFFNICTSDHMEKNNALVGNSGHCNSEMNPSGLEG